MADQAALGTAAEPGRYSAYASAKPSIRCQSGVREVKEGAHFVESTQETVHRLLKEGGDGFHVHVIDWHNRSQTYTAELCIGDKSTEFAGTVPFGSWPESWTLGEAIVQRARDIIAAKLW